MIKPLPKPLKVIHVDDDVETVLHMKLLLESNTDVEYLKGFTSVDEALLFLATERVDLVFLDVEMPGHSGIWFAEHIQQKVDIVFVTGHAGYAEKAFNTSAFDYLMKPVDAEKLYVLLKKILHKKKQDINLQQEQIKKLSNYINPNEKINKIFINMAGSISVVNLNEILYLNSIQNYTVIIFNNGERQTASKNIKSFEDNLRHNHEFLRVSRSYLVNKNFIKSIQRNAKTRSITLMMTNGDLLNTSYKRKEDILEQLISN